MELHRRPCATAEDRVPHRAREAEQERVAELVGLQLARRTPAAAARVGAVLPERVALQRREDLLERPLADLPYPPWRELVAPPILADEACLLEQLAHLLQLLERLPGLRAGEPLDLLGVHGRKVALIARSANDILEIRELVHLVHQPERLREGERIVARQIVLVAVQRHQLTERVRQLVHRGLEARIVERGAEELLELLAHRAGHAVPERPHRGHPHRELLEQIVPVLRVAGELGVLPLERLEVGIAALGALLQRAVEVADHLAGVLELLGRQVLQRVAHVLEIRAEHLLLQLLEELLVFLRGLRLDELVVLEPADRAADVLGERIQLLAPLACEVLHGLFQRVVGRLLLLAAVEALALEALDLIELLLQLVADPRSVGPLPPPLLSRAEAFEEVLHPLHPAGHAPAGEARHRVLEIPAGEQFVGHRAKELVGLERVETLGAVPALVPDVLEEAVLGFLHQPRNVERDSPRSLFSLRLRCRPSSTNSTAAAIAAGFPAAPSFATAPFIPGIWRACFTYSWLGSVGETCIVAPRWNAARSESNSAARNVRCETLRTAR